MTKDMPDLHHHFSHAATLVPVSDMAQSLTFYRDKLGFKISFSWEDPPTYAVLRAGERVHLHLSEVARSAPGTERRSTTLVYIFVYDIDGIYQKYKESGVPIKSPIADQDYGMRDFDVLDPDGNVLCFGSGAGET